MGERLRSIFNYLSRPIYEGQLKSSKADQDTLMECDQMSFIFQLSNAWIILDKKLNRYNFMM